jgi:hypothetical protein
MDDDFIESSVGPNTIPSWRCFMTEKTLVLIVLYFGVACSAVTAQEISQADKDRERAMELLAVARKGLAMVDKPNSGGASEYVLMCTWSQRVLNAELALSRNTAERIAAYEAYLKQTRKLERIARDLYRQQIITQLELLDAEYKRREAELQLDSERFGKPVPGLSSGSARRE